MPIKVCIFEDNEKFLDALSLLVLSMPELEFTGAFESTANLLPAIGSPAADVVLMDIGITPINGIEATRLIIKNYPKTKVLIQTVFDDDNSVFAAICAGASGYLLKTTQANSLLSAIVDVYEGGAPMTPSIASKTLKLFRDHFPEAGRQDEYGLTKREKEVLKLLVDGQSYKMIADRCDISFETVKTYIKRIYEKLHVACMAEAVVKALRENLL
jgi:DNA-binding NarL/FixJ family response regulator